MRRTTESVASATWNISSFDFSWAVFP